MSSAAPIRVVLFYGPFLRSTREFAVRLDAHPDIELAALYCAAPGETRRHQFTDLRRRRGWLGLALFAFELGRDALRRLAGGRREREHRRRWADLAGRVRYVGDMHDPGVMSHTGSDGSRFSERIDRQGYAYASAGENVAWGYGTPEAVVDGWIASDGHCANMMGDGFTDLGAGEAGRFWALVFARPR